MKYRIAARSKRSSLGQLDILKSKKIESPVFFVCHVSPPWYHGSTLTAVNQTPLVMRYSNRHMSLEAETTVTSS